MSETPSPINDIHDETGFDCWCSPTFLAVCIECDDGGDCWQCGGKGQWEVSRADAETIAAPCIAVHNR